MRGKREIIEQLIKASKDSSGYLFFSTSQISDKLLMQRSNVSKILNQMVKEGLLEKKRGKPVLFKYIKETDERSVFSKLIGRDDSLKSAIQLAKAAIMYPDDSLSILIESESGSGSSLFSKFIYEFAKEKKLKQENAPFIKINCRYYANSVDDLRKVLFEQNEKFLKAALGGVIFIDHIEIIISQDDRLIYDLITTVSSMENTTLILSSNKKIESRYQYLLPIKIILPNLNSFKYEERLDFIKLCFNNESSKMKKEIRLDSSLLISLLLYQCSGNFKQLKMDIKIGCANSYARSQKINQNWIEININDLPNYVRKAFLASRENRKRLSNLVFENHIYQFDDSESSAIRRGNGKETVYEWIAKRTVSLVETGLDLSEAETIIIDEVEKRIVKFNQDLLRDIPNIENLSKIVDKRIISLVKHFLSEASEQLSRVFSEEILFGLSLHLSFSIERLSDRERLKETIIEEARQNKKEYELGLILVKRIEDLFKISLYPDEAALVALFISDRDKNQKLKGPVFLIAMHGDTTASSIGDVVRGLTGVESVYTFNLPLIKDMNEAYIELKELMISIGTDCGILMMFDMGSLKSMAESISQETGILVNYVESPTTLLAIECARRTSTGTDIERIMEDIKGSYESYFPSIADNYSRRRQNNVILSLCLTGQGGAMQIKNYLEESLKNSEVDFEVVTLSYADKRSLIDSISKIRSTSNIVAIICSQDINVIDIPFISVSKLFSTPKSQVEKIFQLGLENKDVSKEKMFRRVLRNIESEYDEFDTVGIERFLPEIILKISEDYTLDENQEIGLFMHISAAIYNISKGIEIPERVYQKKYVEANKRIYNNICDYLGPIEEYYGIEYDRSDISNIIKIVKKEK